MFEDQPRLVKRLLMDLAEKDREDACPLLISLLPEPVEKTNAHRLLYAPMLSKEQFKSWQLEKMLMINQSLQCFGFDAWDNMIKS